MILFIYIKHFFITIYYNLFGEEYNHSFIYWWITSSLLSLMSLECDDAAVNPFIHLLTCHSPQLSYILLHSGLSGRPLEDHRHQAWGCWCLWVCGHDTCCQDLNLHYPYSPWPTRTPRYDHRLTWCCCMLQRWKIFCVKKCEQMDN